MNDRYVLDASALLAALFGEPGAEAVDRILADAVIGAVNFSEVVAKLTERGIPEEEATASLAELDLTVIPFDQRQAEIAGQLRGPTRALGLSLGDRSCLALAISLGARAVTTDRAWAEVDVGVTVDVAR